ncbi:MAG: hypothetical protein JKY84_15175, partial [Emcibacteraceae bacterium]|nr:hypothetical protein [Emcibacteraceae bacterium]
MSRILQFKGRRQSTSFMSMLLVAIVIGAVVGFYIPDHIYQFNNSEVKASSKLIKGDIKGHAVITDGDTIKI